MNDWKRQKGIGKNRNSSTMVAKRYTMPINAAEQLKKAAPSFGSQGRAIQVATEILSRMEKPPAAKGAPRQMTRATFRLHTSTAELIEALSKKLYDNDRGEVFAACVKVLKMRKIKI